MDTSIISSICNNKKMGKRLTKKYTVYCKTFYITRATRVLNEKSQNKKL